MNSILSESEYLNDDKLLTEKEFHITYSPVSVLTKKVEKLQLTRVEILIAFIKKAALSGRLPKDFNMADALMTAVYCDWLNEFNSLEKNISNDRLQNLTGTSYKLLGLEQKMLVAETYGLRKSMGNRGVYARSRIPSQFKI